MGFNAYEEIQTMDKINGNRTGIKIFDELSNLEQQYTTEEINKMWEDFKPRLDNFNVELKKGLDNAIMYGTSGYHVDIDNQQIKSLTIEEIEEWKMKNKKD